MPVEAEDKMMHLESAANNSPHLKSRQYVSAPIRKNFFRRVQIQILKRLTKISGHCRLLFAGEHMGAQMISNKNCKAVFYNGKQYFSVYLNPKKFNRKLPEIAAALKPVKIVNQYVFIYPAVEISRRAAESDVLRLISSYTSITNPMTLSGFLHKYHDDDESYLSRRIKEHLLNNYPATLKIEVAFCHGDVTQQNIGVERNEALVLFDWDDSFEHIAKYDCVYFLMSEYFSNHNVDFTYQNVLLTLGIGEDTWNVNRACEIISSLVSISLSRVECLLFMLRYFKTIREIDGVSSILFGEIHEMVF